jgi:hypothetical protein
MAIRASRVINHPSKAIVAGRLIMAAVAIEGGPTFPLRRLDTMAIRIGTGFGLGIPSGIAGATALCQSRKFDIDFAINVRGRQVGWGGVALLAIRGVSLMGSGCWQRTGLVAMTSACAIFHSLRMASARAGARNTNISSKVVLAMTFTTLIKRIVPFSQSPAVKTYRALISES